MSRLSLASFNPAPIRRQRAIRRAGTVDGITQVEREMLNSKVIAALEGMLERARTGEIAGMVAAFIDPEGVCTYMLTGAADASPALAADVAARLQVKVGSRMAWTDKQAVDH
ncbi:hypothetical protein [Burkholderia seminalis]|uniref:Uncharacterized protein n=2 Tax=Burkholderia cepacia complex TaxID=87882 RepID=A0A8A8D573_9BURK|nr:hypothetical protein [Burkholderia seminalis]QTO19905.1 hypothetical protein DT99_006630 [Burkholderia seminalis]